LFGTAGRLPRVFYHGYRAPAAEGKAGRQPLGHGFGSRELSPGTAGFRVTSLHLFQSERIADEKLLPWKPTLLRAVEEGYCSTTAAAR